MKISNRFLSSLIMISIAWCFAASTSIRAQEARSESGPVNKNNARLIVNRSAAFGVEESINLAVDGVQVAVLGINQNYDAALPPGKHVLSISTNPKTYGQDSPNQILVNAEPGETYTFEAVWDDSERASLEEQ
jgi:hypothetical protein